MPGTSGLPLSGVEAIVEGLSSFQSDIRSMNSALESIQPRQTLLQRGFSSLTDGIVNFGKGVLQWGVDTLASLGSSIIHIAEYAIGQLLADAIEWAVTKLKELGKATLEAGMEFQTLELRLQGMNLQEISDRQLDYVDATEMAAKMTREQLDWLQKLAAATPFDNTDISNVYSLARSYGFMDEQARELTESTINYTASMGLSGDVLERVIQNMGQMVARGKITSTEIRDLARGAFLPVNDILQRIVDNMNATGASFVDNSEKISAAGSKIEDYQDKLRILRQKQEEWTDKTKESTKMALFEQIQELEEKIAQEQGKLGALQVEETQKMTLAELTKQIQTPEGIPAQFFIDAFNEMIKEEPRFTEGAERMARTFQYAAANVLDMVKSIGGLNIVKPILDVIGGRIASFMDEFTKTDRWDRLVAAATRVGQALSIIIQDIFGLLPSADSLAEGLIQTVNRVADWLEEHRGDIVSWFRNAYDFITEKLIPKLKEIFTTLKEAIAEFQKTGFSDDFLEKLGFKPETADKIIAFVDGIRKTLDRILEWVDENGPLIKEFFQALGNIVSGFFDDLLGGEGGKPKTGDILDSITRFMQYVVDNQDKILRWVEILWSVFVVWQVLTTIWNIAIGIVITLGGVILGIIAVVSALAALLSGPVVLAVALLVAGFAAAVLAGKLLGDAIVAALLWIRDNVTFIDWRALGMSIIQGLITGVSQFIPGLGEALIGGMMRIYQRVREFLGIHSPSTLFRDLGYDLMQGLADGISAGFWNVLGAVTDAANNIRATINNLWADIGMGASMGWAYGIETGGASAVTSMGNVVEKTAKGAKRAMRARSPSKLFEELGVLTMEGFAQGIERAAGLAVGAMSQAMSSVALPAVSSLAVARASGGDTITNNRTANLTINTSAPAEPIIADFQMLQSMVGV